jgi:tetratricopeptide (TPR) repeat protein
VGIDPTSNGTLEDFPTELQSQASLALDAERQSIEKGIDAWKKLVGSVPAAWEPRRELARLYKQAERWKACVEILKEAVDKATWPAPEAKIPPLLEMAEIYRERLKLEVNVIDSYNRILAIQPGNIEVMDALVGQLESSANPRWPDIISLLRKKAAAVEAPEEKIALLLRVANLYIERFQNQAEAIKCFEAILEIDAANPEAIAYLKQMYEKRRDWDRLIAVLRQEVGRIEDTSERARRWAEVAKLATEKLKKVPVSIELWSKVLEIDNSDAEALAELEKLYEREKRWEELAAVLQKQVDLTVDPAKRGVLLPKLALLCTEKLQKLDRAIVAWKTLLDAEPDNRRAQDALRKLYLQNKDWDALEGFYSVQGKWDEFVRVLERQAETEDDVTRVGLWNKIATLYQDRVAKPDKAQKAFEKTLSLDPANLVAAEALIPIYEKAKDAAKLAGVLRVQLAHTTQPTLRQERMQRIVQILDTEAGEKSAALAVALQATGENPAEAWALEAGQRLAAETGEWAALVQVYETALPSLKGERSLPLLVPLARAYEKELANFPLAIERNKRVLAVVPGDEQAVLALERLYVATGQHEELLAIYDKKLAMAGSDAEKREVRLQLALLYEEQVRDVGKALSLYRDILKTDPDDLQALRALGRLYQATEQWKDLVKVIERQLALCASDAVACAELKFGLGEVSQKYLDDPAGAVAAFKEALALDANHPGARAALEGYLGAKKYQMAAVGALEPIYEALHDIERLIEVQRIKLKREKDSAGKVALQLRIGALEAEAGRTEAAYDAYAAAFAEDPASSDARAALEHLADSLGKWDSLVEIYQNAHANAKLDSALEREILLVVAVAYDEKLGQSEKAVEYFRLAQEIEPEDASALEALERLYTRTERWPDLVETLKKKAELVQSVEAREGIHARIATIQEEAIGNLDEAIVAWKEVLGDNSSSLEALRALDRLFVQKGMALDLADNLQRQFDLASDPDQQVVLLWRLGQLRERALGDVSAAIETYRRLLDFDPSHQETIGALENLLSVPEHELALAELLDPVYRGRGDFANLVRTLEIQSRHTPDVRRRIELLHEIATAREDGMDDPAGAYEALGRALAEDPLDRETQTRLERLAKALGRVDDLVGRFRAVVATVQADEGKNAVHHVIALLAEQDLGNVEIATEAYRQAMATSPRDGEAADALERIYSQVGDYASLVLLLQQKIEMTDAVPDKRELGMRAAKIWEEVLENSEKAIEVYRQTLALDETDAVVLDDLERLYIRLERWSDLKDIYAKQAELATDPAQKKARLFVLGQVYDRELRDPARAIETYSSLLDIDPDDVEAMQALDRLYLQTERWLDLLSMLERQTDLCGSAGEVVSLRFRIGELWREKLNDPSRAVEAYKRVLETDPTHEPTMRAIEGMMERGEEPIAAAEVLQPIYESAGDWDKVAVTCEVMVSNTQDAIRRVELLETVASIYERRLSNVDAAFDAYCRAMRVDPSNVEVTAHLDRLADASGRWAELASALESEIERVTDNGLQVEMLMRLARLYEEETREIDKAIATFKRVADAEPDRKDGLVALDRLYTVSERWQDLADVVRREIRLADSEDQIVSFTFRLAQILEVALGDLPKAVEAYQEILGISPQHQETRATLEQLMAGGNMQREIAQVLEPLYRMGEEWEKLVNVYQVELLSQSDPEERQRILRRLADITEGKLLDQVAALDWWARALVEAPSSEQALDEVLRLARTTRQWEAYVATMSEAAGKTADLAARKNVLMRLATVFESELGDLARAEEVLGQILALDAEDAEALAFLDRVCDKQGDFEKLAGVLRRRIALADDSRHLVELHLRLGKVLADVIDDPEAAVKSYLAVVEQESRSPEALEALERLYFRAERWQDLYGVYEKMLDIAPGDQALSDCYARMAKITSDVLGQRDQAVELWRRVLDLRGADPVALSALADLHEQAEEWRELTEVLDSQIRAIEDPAARIPVYKRLGRVWGEKLGRERNALECWQKVVEIDGGDVEALRAIADNYRSAGAWEELSEILRRTIEVGMQVLSNAEVKELYAQLGDLEGTTLLRIDAAVEAWREVLRIDVNDFRALTALEALFTQEARWEECVEVLERRATALASPEEKVDVLMQAASIWFDKVGDGGAATDAYERVLQIDPSNLQASIQLEELYRQRKVWPRLVELLLGRIEYVDGPAERIKLLIAIAAIYEEQLDDRDSAFVTLQAAFREDYSNDHVAKELDRLATATGKWNELLTEYTQVAQGMSDDKQAADLWVKIARWYDSALEHTEYAVVSAKKALSLDSEHTGAMSALADFYRKLGQWKELVAILSKHAEIEQDPGRKVEVLLALAETFELQLSDAGQATAAYEQALRSDERCLAAIDALERLHRRNQAWDRLAEILGKKSQVVSDVDLAVKLRLQVGELWESRLGDNERALEAYREVLTVDPQNLPALKALEQLYLKSGRTEAYLEVLEHQLEVTPADAERVGLYLRMAKVWEGQPGKADRAIECLQSALEIDSSQLGVYRDIERLLRAERNWDALVDIYRRHIQVEAQAQERTTIHLALGHIFEEELRDPDRAAESYNDILAFDPDHTEALKGLAGIYEQTEQWDRAVEIMERLVNVVEAKEKVNLSYRLGKIFDEHMQMPESAEERLSDALSVDPTHVPSMVSLINLYKRRGDSLKAAQMMVRAEACTQNVLEKTRLLFEAGKLYQNELGDAQKAKELYARTLEIDPEHVEAGAPLAELYFKGQEWAPLVPVLEMLARKTDRRANKELHVLNYRLAKAADKLGDEEKALKCYRHAYELDPTHLPTLVDRADLLYRRQQWDDAFKLYQTVIVQHRESQSDVQIVEIFHRIGVIKMKVGERAKSINMFEKALELNAGHRPTLEALAEVYAEAGDWEAVIKQKRSLLAHSASVDEKVRFHEEIIAIYKEKLANPQKAIAAYLEAIDVKPDARNLLVDVIELLYETKQWKKAVEILLRLANLEAGKTKAKYLETAGMITNQELHSPDEAVDLFNQALDEYPDSLKPFERIDKIMTAKKDWVNQQRNYRKMLKRLGQDVGAPEKKATQLALWHGLGEIYRSRLKMYREAAEAFEVCVRLEPDNVSRQQILAELYQVQGPECYDKAIRAYRTLMARAKDVKEMVPSLKILRRMYAELGKYDQVWCVAATLAYLKQADAEELRFFEQYRSKGLARVKARLTEENWQKHVFHPNEDRYVSLVLASISQTVIAIRAQEHKEYGIRRKDRRDLASDQLMLSRVFVYAGQILGVSMPELYLRQDWGGDMEFVSARDKQQLCPAVIVGAALLQGKQEKELAYALGKRMTLLRSDHVMRWPRIVPQVSELKAFFLAALKIVEPKVPVKGDMEQPVAERVELLRRFLPPQHMEQLAEVVRRFLESKVEADLHKWAHAVDYTSTRAGFLLCNDLEIAAQQVLAEPIAVGSADPKDKVRDLIQWSVSEEYFELRGHLGLSIG